MLKKITQLFKSRKKKSDTNFFELPSRKQKKLILKAVRDANKEQKALVDKYNKKYDSAGIRCNSYSK